MDLKNELVWIRGSVIMGLLGAFFAGYFIIEDESNKFFKFVVTWLIVTCAVYGACLVYRGRGWLVRRLEKLKNDGRK